MKARALKMGTPSELEKKGAHTFSANEGRTRNSRLERSCGTLVHVVIKGPLKWRSTRNNNLKERMTLDQDITL
ncbi:MAG TPA: hypothetical protein VJ574_06435 [Candidatus Bathyarchaeia archaeon]|nr:MAG: hypothetical protein A3K70_00045 [Candidatus Bathyarchaeota archaeon RBG_16_48_13]HJX24018.1 hypothetical protein [Candidatus Bathyarchaeia archaeon]